MYKFVLSGFISNCDEPVTLKGDTLPCIFYPSINTYF